MRNPPNSNGLVMPPGTFLIKSATIIAIVVVLWWIHASNYEAENISSEIIVNEAPTLTTVDDSERFGVNQNGFWEGGKGASKRHVFDQTLAASLVRFFKSVGANTILELGAGEGKYTKLFRESGFFVTCYDGNPSTQDLSEGRCGILDLSKSLDLSRHDWVMSLEVGEHIPGQFETNFISNLDKGNIHGIVLSWAIEGQGGTSHVNNRNNSYIKQAFEKLGYDSKPEEETKLRTDATMGWFKNTIMVFKRKA